MNIYHTNVFTTHQTVELTPQHVFQYQGWTTKLKMSDGYRKNLVDNFVGKTLVLSPFTWWTKHVLKCEFNGLVCGKKNISAFIISKVPSSLIYEYTLFFCSSKKCSWKSVKVKHLFVFFYHFYFLEIDLIPKTSVSGLS